MNVMKLHAKELRSKVTWFDATIERDPWIVYHGTSSANEETIDASGLQAGENTFAEAAVRACRFFESLDWEGPSRKNCGYSVLHAYSLHRLSGQRDKPVFCALYPQRTQIYLWSDFCGGETAYALRKAIPAIREFASDEAAQERHFNQTYEKFAKNARSGLLPSERVIRPNKKWIRAQADFLGSVEKELNAMVERHAFGVLYALRLTPSDIVGAWYSWVDGLRIYKPIPATRIVAKLQIEGAELLYENNSSESLLDSNSWREESELVKCVRCGSPVPEERVSRQKLRDPDAGEDITLEVVREHGTQAVKEWYLSRGPRSS